MAVIFHWMSLNHKLQILPMLVSSKIKGLCILSQSLKNFQTNVEEFPNKRGRISKQFLTNFVWKFFKTEEIPNKALKNFQTKFGICLEILQVNFGGKF